MTPGEIPPPLQRLLANACHDDEDEDEDEQSKQRDQTREEEVGNDGEGDTSKRPSLFRIESVVAAKNAARTASLKSLGAASEASGSKRSSRSRVTVAVEGPAEQSSPGSPAAAGIGPSGFVMPRAAAHGPEAASSDGRSLQADGENKGNEGEKEEEEEDDEGPVGFIAPNALSSQPANGAVDFFGVQRPMSSGPQASSAVGFVPPKQAAAAEEPGQEDAVRASAESAESNNDEEGPLGFVSPHLMAAPAAAGGPVDFFGVPRPASAPVMPSKVDSKAPEDTSRGFSMPQKGPEAQTEGSKEVVRASMESVKSTKSDDEGPMGFIAPHLLPGPPAGPVDFFGVRKPVAASQEEEALRDWISSRRSEEPKGFVPPPNKEAAPGDSAELATTNNREPRHQTDSLKGTQGSFQRDAVMMPDSEPWKPMSSKGTGHEGAVRASMESVKSTKSDDEGPMGFIAPHLLPGPPAGPVDFFGVRKPVAASQEEEALRDWISSRRSEEPKGFVPPKEAAGEAARASVESVKSNKSEEEGPMGFIAPHAVSAPASAGPVDFFGVQQPVTASQELLSLPKVDLSPQGTQYLQQQQQEQQQKPVPEANGEAVRASAESLRSNKSDASEEVGFIAPSALAAPSSGAADFFGVQQPVASSLDLSQLQKPIEEAPMKGFVPPQGADRQEASRKDASRMSIESAKSTKSEDEGPSGFIAPQALSSGPAKGPVDFFGVQKPVTASQELSELPRVTETAKASSIDAHLRASSAGDKGGKSYDDVVRMSMESVKSNKSEEGPTGFIAPSAVSTPSSGVVDFFGVQKPVRTSQEITELPKVTETKPEKASSSFDGQQLRSSLQEDKGGKSYDDVVRMSMESVKSNKSEEGPKGFIAPSAVSTPSSGFLDFFGVQKPVRTSQEITELPKVTETKPAKASSDDAQLRSSVQGTESGQPSSRGFTGYEDAVRASMESLKSNRSEEGGAIGFIAPHALSPPPPTTVDFFGVQQPVRASQELTDLPKLVKTESSEMLQDLQQSAPLQDSSTLMTGTGFVMPPKAAAAAAVAEVLVASSTITSEKSQSPTSPPPPPAVPCFGVDQRLQQAGAPTPKFGMTGDGRRAVPPSSIDFSGSSRPFQINSTSPGSSGESEKARRMTLADPYHHRENGIKHADHEAAAREAWAPTQTPPLDPEGYSRGSRLSIDPSSAPAGRTQAEHQYSPTGARGRFMNTDSSAFVFPRSEGRAAGTAGRPTLSARMASESSAAKPVTLFNAMHASSSPSGGSDSSSSYSRSAALSNMSSSYRERRYHDAPSGHHHHHQQHHQQQQHEAHVAHPPAPRGQQTVSDILKEMQPYSRSPSSPSGMPSSLVSANGVFSSASRAAVMSSRDAAGASSDRDAPLSSYGGRRRPAFPRDVFADNPLFSSTR